MGRFQRKSRFERAIDTVGAPLNPKAVKSRLDDVHPPRSVKSGLAAVGGAIAVTAGSAAVSAVRRRGNKGSERHS